MSHGIDEVKIAKLESRIRALHLAAADKTNFMSLLRRIKIQVQIDELSRELAALETKNAARH